MLWQYLQIPLWHWDPVVQSVPFDLFGSGVGVAVGLGVGVRVGAGVGVGVEDAVGQLCDSLLRVTDKDESL